MPLLRAVLVGAALVAPAAGCESILDVDDNDVTSRDLLTTPEAIPTLRAGAISDFTIGYEQLINLGGMVADEFINSETFPTRIQMDRRAILTNNSNLTTLFAQVATANAAPEFAAGRITEILAANPTATTFTAPQAETINLAAMAKVAIAEHFCEGVPLSRLTVTGSSLEFNYGSPLTRQQMLDSAISQFSRARGVLGSGTTAAVAAQRNLSIVGQARALLNKANSQAEIAQVLTFLQANRVPRNYTYQLQHSTNSGGENNQVFTFNNLNERISVANNEGINGLPFRSAGPGKPSNQDPRVLSFRRTVGGAPNVGFDGSTPQWDAQKYPAREAFTVIASGVEASLMAAEGHLAAGNPQAMLDSLNVLRANVQALMQLHNFNYVAQQQLVGYGPGVGATLDPLTLPATTAAQVDLLFRERAFWLAFTGHRLGDLRRLVRQYGRPQETVFPTGPYHKGGTYGSDVNFPIPVQEANNPNAPTTPEAQCMNRNA
jgi:hypothetical protein